jgi:hypothetical protein
MTKSILIFPSGMPHSLAYLEQALTEGHRVVGSCSLMYNPSSDHYPSWTYLPYVTDDNFMPALREVISSFGSTGIFTSNIVTLHYLISF